MVQAVVSLSFLALGVFTVVDWLRHRERSRGYLALALATLGLTSVLGQLNALIGYRVPAVGGLTLILLVAGFGGTTASNPVVRWLFEGVALVAVPLLYVSFAAPRWLRRLWRQGEEDEYRDAVHDLVLFSPDRPTLARRASEWGLRLVGAEGIAIVDANGEILALRGLTRETAHRLAAQVDPKGQPSLLATQGSRRDDAIVVPLPLDLGLGAMVVVSGPYTPFFGTDEV